MTEPAHLNGPVLQYSVVLAAQQAAAERVRPGVPCAEAARSAREVIDGSGYGDYAAERQSRGVGLILAEGPWLVAGETFAPGMTVCLEPAIYLPELFGARVRTPSCAGMTGPSASAPARALRILDH